MRIALFLSLHRGERYRHPGEGRGPVTFQGDRTIFQVRKGKKIYQ